MSPELSSADRVRRASTRISRVLRGGSLALAVTAVTATGVMSHPAHAGGWADTIKSALPGLAGSAGGALIGNQFGSGGGRRAMTIVGAVVGGVVGTRIGEHARGQVSPHVYPARPDRVVPGTVLPREDPAPRASASRDRFPLPGSEPAPAAMPAATSAITTCQPVQIKFEDGARLYCLTQDGTLVRFAAEQYDVHATSGRLGRDGVALGQVRQSDYQR